MPSYSTEAICNIALVGHHGAGKTTLAEQLLYHSGVIGAPGSVEKGTTVCDHDALEKAYGHSLESAVAHFEYGDRQVNLIDTPGFPDFIGRALSVLPAVETAAVVINAQAGIEPVAQRAMEEAARRRLCRMVVVNRIDTADNLERILEQIQTTFGRECLPINLPAGGSTRVVDCFFNPSGEADFSSVEAAHTALIEQVVSMDERLMELYLDQGEVSPEQLHDPFEKALRESDLVPICFVSAQTGAGVPELLEVLTRLLPNPLEGNPIPFLRSNGDGTEEEIHPQPDPSARVLAHVFKVYIDPFIGKVGVVRVPQGTLRRDHALLIGDARKPVKLSKLHKLRGKDLIEIDAAIAGDICAVAKVDDLHYDAVLHDSHEDDMIRMRPVELPPPVFSLAIEPQRRGDEKKLSDALHKLEAEDTCFRVERNTSTKETVIYGYGDLHLRTILDQMRERYHVEVQARPPKIAYRETITASAEGHCRHKKQTGGAGQFGEVFLRIEPLPRGAGFEFVNKVVGGVIPTSLIPAVEKGVHQVLESGAISGHPLQDIRVTVYDGKHHPVDSKEVAFTAAGRKAFLDAIQKAGPIVLEPIANVEVTAPEPSMGGITGDIASKRGRIIGTQTLSDSMVTISAEVPLSELAQYESELKSLTGGQGSYTLEFKDYEPVPEQIQEKIVAAHRPHAVED